MYTKHIKSITLGLALLVLIPTYGQRKRKSFGEKMGDFAGNLMTKKTDVLAPAVAKGYYYCGVYPMSAETSETNYMPVETVEGDHIVSVTFFKNEGVGLLKIKGDVTCNGEEMEYVGMGSYLIRSATPFASDPVIEIKTKLGDAAKMVLHPIASVDLLSVNGQSSLPVLDLAKDLEIEIMNPAGAENTQIKVSLISNAMGARFLNHFITFPSGEAGIRKIKIPKQALANPEVIGQLNAGNFDQGENLIIVERVRVTESDKLGTEQNKGQLSAMEITTIASSSMPVIVKGKQEGGLNVNLKIAGKTASGAGFDVYKPSATYGIPLSQASSFGLASFSLDGKTFEESTSESKRDVYYGGTRYTRTTTTTYTYQFPELPDARWNMVMDEMYKRLTALLSETYSINTVPVEKITRASQYNTLFGTDKANNKYAIKISYANTLRTEPESLFEILGSASSNQTSDVPMVNMMKEAEVDGLISINLKYTVGGNSSGKMVLVPQLKISISGRDENNNNKQGSYFTGLFTTDGATFNTEAVKTNDAALLKACSVQELMGAVEQALAILKLKEAELGYDAIYTVGR